MADNAALDSFLSAGAPQEAPAEPPATPAPESTPPPSSTPPEPAAKAPETDEDEASALEARDGEVLVPRRAYEDEKRKRNDWKTKYAAEQAKAELLAKQLEEAKRPPAVQQTQPQPQQQYIPPPPDPRVDPGGWAQHQVLMQQHAELNRNLNTSEWIVRDKFGDEAVDAAIAEFKAATEKDPTLWGKLYSQPMPYAWLVKETERLRAIRDVVDDPAAYRSKIEAELRAKLEAEFAEQHANGGNGRTVTVSPAAGLPPSLANARSVAGRTQSTFTGPPPLSELFPGHQRRVQSR